MEKNTDSDRAISEKKYRFAAIAGRPVLTALLISAVILVSLPGHLPAETQSLPSYRSASFSTGANPSAAKIGDLDDDGLNDIAVVNRQGNLQLFFNNGAGSFDRVSLSGLWPSSSNTLDVDIGDMNGDGRNDIAVAFSTQGGAISVLFNQGNRTFSSPLNYNLCSSSIGVAIGDLDLDGDNDLADISQCSRSGILINGGQGSFAFSGAYGNGSGSESVALADFNRDGFKDIAYVNNGLDSITVLFNNRNATFGSTALHYVGDFPDDLAVGDFDDDGDVDIAVANSYYSQIFILLNGGSGNFPSYSEFYGGDTPSSITGADLNGDGLLDIAVTSRAANRLSVLINRGNYSFAGPTAFNVGQSPVDIAAGNLDGDLLPDLVTVNQGNGTITVLFTGSGTSPAPPPTDITLSASQRTTRRSKLVDLRWSGATGARIDIYRNGARIAIASNTGSYTDQMGSRTRGTFTYKVCVTGSQNCSNESPVSF